MKWKRRPRPAAEPLRIELAGLPGQLVPSSLNIQHHHLIERKPTQPPTRMWVAIDDRVGRRWVGQQASLQNYPGRVQLQLPAGAQICLKDIDTGNYIPLDHFNVEFTWDRY